MKLITLICFAISMPVSLIADETKEQAFWSWFEKNQDELFHFEKDREAVFDRLSTALKRVHPDLTFEFGPARKEGAREFVISAGGIKAAFPSVEALCAVAPKLPKWTIIKYRQRQLPIKDVEFAGRKVKASEVHYAIFQDGAPEKVGIMVFLDGYTEGEERAVWAHIGYLLLDEALGELDVETHVGAIVFSNRQSKHFEHAHPLSELPRQFDERFGRKKGR